jgi:hypothetical protein
VPWLPFRLLSNYVGSINNDVFLGCAAETVQFLGAGSNRQVDMNGQVLTQLEMKLKWRPKSWNMDFRPDTSTWDYVLNIAASPRYKTLNFLTLITFRDFSGVVPGWL